VAQSRKRILSLGDISARTDSIRQTAIVSGFMLVEACVNSFCRNICKLFLTYLSGACFPVGLGDGGIPSAWGMLPEMIRHYNQGPVLYPMCDLWKIFD
jgi:hypothetical protein